MDVIVILTFWKLPYLTTEFRKSLNKLTVNQSYELINVSELSAECECVFCCAYVTVVCVCVRACLCA